MNDYVTMITTYVELITPYALVWGLSMKMVEMFVIAVTGRGEK